MMDPCNDFYAIRLPNGKFFCVHHRDGSSQIRTALNFPIFLSLDDVVIKLRQICLAREIEMPETYMIVLVHCNYLEVLPPA